MKFHILREGVLARSAKAILGVRVGQGQLGLYSWLRQGGGFEFTDFFANAVRGDAFVVMQFSGFEELYTDVIEPVEGRLPCTLLSVKVRQKPEWLKS